MCCGGSGYEVQLSQGDGSENDKAIEHAEDLEFHLPEFKIEDYEAPPLPEYKLPEYQESCLLSSCEGSVQFFPMGVLREIM